MSKYYSVLCVVFLAVSSNFGASAFIMDEGHQFSGYDSSTEKWPIIITTDKPESGSKGALSLSCFGRSTDAEKALPSVVELVMSAVKDQLKLGSCTAFTTAALMEYSVPDTYFSEAALYISAKTTERASRHAEGTSFRDYSSAHGVFGVLESGLFPEYAAFYEYMIKHKAGKVAKTYSSNLRESVDHFMHWCKENKMEAPDIRWRTMGYYNEMEETYKRWRFTMRAIDHSSIETIKRVLTKLPVGLAVKIFRKGYNPWGDSEIVENRYMITMPKEEYESDEGHAICVCGYDDARNAFKFKNSWGPGWGNGGYAWLPYEYVAKYATAAVVLMKFNTFRTGCFADPKKVFWGDFKEISDADVHYARYVE
jgi:hypothetical protein